MNTTSTDTTSTNSTDTTYPRGLRLTAELARELEARGAWRRIAGHNVAVVFKRSIRYYQQGHPFPGKPVPGAHRHLWASREGALKGVYEDFPLVAFEVSGPANTVYGPFDRPEDAVAFIARNLL